MIHILQLTVRCVLLSLLFSSSAAAQQKPAITHVTVIDANGAPARPNMTVIFERGRIVRLGTSRTLRVPEGARVVDASNKFLITRSARLPIAIVPEVARRFRNFAGFRVADTILFL